MILTYYGHSCFGAQLEGKSLLFDPFITPNEKASGIDIDTIPADYILISHGHQDHLADAENIARRTGATIISVYEIVMWYKEKGIEGHPMNTGGMWEFDFGTVKLVQAVHSSVLPDGTYAGNPVGFVITSNDVSFYFSGDTALTLDMQLIAQNSRKLDFAILCLGNNFTMGYKDAIIASDFVSCNKIIASHYDTFGWIEVDQEEVTQAFKARGKEITFLEIGKNIELNG